MKYSTEYERAIATVIKMMAPMAPHFCSELWSHLVNTPNRIANDSHEILWNKNVLDQNWAHVDENYKIDLLFKVMIFIRLRMIVHDFYLIVFR